MDDLITRWRGCKTPLFTLHIEMMQFLDELNADMAKTMGVAPLASCDPVSDLSALFPLVADADPKLADAVFRAVEKMVCMREDLAKRGGCKSRI